MNAKECQQIGCQFDANMDDMEFLFMVFIAEQFDQQRRVSTKITIVHALHRLGGCICHTERAAFIFFRKFDNQDSMDCGLFSSGLSRDRQTCSI